MITGQAQGGQDLLSKDLTIETVVTGQVRHYSWWYQWSSLCWLEAGIKWQLADYSVKITRQWPWWWREEGSPLSSVWEPFAWSFSKCGWAWSQSSFDLSWNLTKKKKVNCPFKYTWNRCGKPQRNRNLEICYDSRSSYLIAFAAGDLQGIGKINGTHGIYSTTHQLKT